MKKLIVILLTARCSYSSAQGILSVKESEIFNTHHLLKTKSLHVRTYYNDGIAEGTGFLIRKKGLLYFVTNYHVIPGKTAYDTTLNDVPNSPLPHRAKIYFYARNGKKAHPVAYNLRHLKYYRIPDNYHNLLKVNTRRSVADLVFIPVGKIENFINADTIDLTKPAPVPQIREGSLLSIWGFHHEVRPYGLVCSVDTVLSDKNVNYYKTRQYIYFKAFKNIDGDSGAPVYLHAGNKLTFIGIHSNHLPANIYRDKLNAANIGCIISRDFISECISKYLP